MTILDIRNHLYTHFLQHTMFNVVEDGPKLALGGVYDGPKAKLGQYKDSLLRAALREMEQAGFLTCLDATKGVYALRQPLASANQQVVISPVTAQLVGNAFDLFAAIAEVQVTSNRLAITDAEINTVAQTAIILQERVMALQEQLEDLLEADGGPEMPPPDPEAN